MRSRAQAAEKLMTVSSGLAATVYWRRERRRGAGDAPFRVARRVPAGLLPPFQAPSGLGGRLRLPVSGGALRLRQALRRKPALQRDPSAPRLRPDQVPHRPPGEAVLEIPAGGVGPTRDRGAAPRPVARRPHP